MHFRFDFDAWPMHSPFRFVHLMHHNFKACALFCHNPLAEVDAQLLIYRPNSSTPYLHKTTLLSVTLR